MKRYKATVNAAGMWVETILYAQNQAQAYKLFQAIFGSSNVPQLQESAREAARAAERHLDEVRAAKWQASANHEEAMRAESDRLEELQKQTQILLEGQITNEEAYQRGFDLEDEYLNLLLTEDGRVYWEIYEPYLVARLNAAYEKGAQDRLEKEFESNYPGLNYMKQEAYGHGYQLDIAHRIYSQFQGHMGSFCRRRESRGQVRHQFHFLLKLGFL